MASPVRDSNYELQYQVATESTEEDQEKILQLFEKIQFLKNEVPNIKEINNLLKSAYDRKKS